MKKIMLIVAVFSTIFASCDSGRDDIFASDIKEVAEDSLWYEVGEIKNYTFDEYVDSLCKVESGLATAVAMIKMQMPAELPSQLTFTTISYKYKSTDGSEVPTDLSALMIVPNVKGMLIKQQLLIDNRATQTSNHYVPTNNLIVGSVFALTGTPMVSADLLGYGASKDKPLNYCCYHLAGKNIVDAAMVAQQILHSKWMKLVVLSQPLPVYNVGYSQGGYNALAVHRYLEVEASEKEKEQLPLVKSYCGSGPYALQRMMDVTENLPYYLYTPYLITGFMSSMAYHSDLYPVGASVTDVLKTSTIATGIVDMLEAKELGNSQVIGAYMQAMGGMPTPISYCFSPEVLDHSNLLYNIAHKALEAEDLTVGWKPTKPIFFYHAKYDDCVPVECSYAARDAFAGCPGVTFLEDPTSAEMQLHSKMYSNFLGSVLQMGWK